MLTFRWEVLEMTTL